MTRPIIAWLTDFGTRDHYAGAMKGVALAICRSATLVDITHEVPPQDVLAGAIELAACYRYFPQGTVFVAVVDPGVGSGRRAVAVAAGPYVFIAPDNGVLSLVLDELPIETAVELTEARYARPNVSRTFEGRDRFAPAAAWVASGIELSALGPPVDATRLVRVAVPFAVLDGAAVRGEVLRVDRFGNLVTNITPTALAALGPGPLIVRIGDRTIAGVVSTYGDRAAGQLCALVGSSGHLEIAVNCGSAAHALGIGRGAAVHVARSA